jgi:hypothetical protein
MSDAYEELLREMITSVIVETGLTESIAAKCASATMTVLQERKAANGWLYVSTPRHRLNELQIRSDLKNGKSINQVCREHRTTRRRLKRELPDVFSHKYQQTSNG